MKKSLPYLGILLVGPLYAMAQTITEMVTSSSVLKGPAASALYGSRTANSGQKEGL